MNLDTRMKKYEYVTRTYLTCRMPVIVRLDGKAFHTFTRGLKKPFDPVFNSAMDDTMLHLAQNSQNCMLAYRQSDEISLLLVDYATFETAAWFDNNISKIVSITASMATAVFNESFKKHALAQLETETDPKYCNALRRCIDNLALFDSRAFNIPREEVANCFWWRQKDAIKNSIASLGQAHFSPRELHGKHGQQIQEMLETKGISWEDAPTPQKRGACALRNDEGQWHVDHNIPVFTADWNYIDRFVDVDL